MHKKLDGLKMSNYIANFTFNKNKLEFCGEIAKNKLQGNLIINALGRQGKAATIEVGTTTTGAPGTDASVTNVGTPNDAILDFLIPRGDRGATAVVVSDTEPTDPEVEIWLKPDGVPILPLLYLDGGRADSVYTSEQIINGGNA